ncbi:MAG: ATP synthase F1 subunit epsilon [Hyphomicrobium sp.]|nr:ATP synthase F1 subunit epsilon [Hyphomicrobium sp.]PPC82382.1 MAG: ATP synthase F1 subunit epsilon [Hyphomicrobium sp.]
MAGTFKFELVSPERIVMSVDADQVRLPGSDGDFTVLAGHSPVIANLRPGTVDVMVQGVTKRVFLKSGFADVQPDVLTVLAKDATDVAELTGARLAAEIEMAELAFKDAKHDEDRRMAYDAVMQLKLLQGGKAA